MRRHIYKLQRISAVFAVLLLLLVPATSYAANPGYAASDVIGQLTGGNPDFTTSNPGLTDSTFSYASGTALDTIHHRLFVNDCGNNRILVYNLDAENNLLDHIADNVLGQPNFTTNTWHLTQNGLSCPYLGIAYDGSHNQLFVADENNNRVIVYDLSSGITDGMNASHVLGQPNFSSNSAVTPAQGTVGAVQDISYDTADQLLFVDDQTNSRVLVYDLSSGITDGMNAAHVLGQPNFASDTPNLSQDGMNKAGAVAYDSVTKQLFVGEEQNDRVLVYDLSSGITDGMNAAHVLGQPNFSTNTHTTTQNGFGNNEGLGIDPTRGILYVADDGNNRILVFDLSSGITDGMNASLVLGQPDFIGSNPDTSQTGINDPESSISVDSANNRIYFSDSNNNRVLVYNFATLTTSPAAPTLNSPYSQALGSQTRGVATYAVASGTLPNGLSLDPNTGILSGTPSKAGTFNFAIRITDTNGTAGSYTYSHAYVLGVSTKAQLTNTGTPILLTTSAGVILISSAFGVYYCKPSKYRLYRHF